MSIRSRYVCPSSFFLLFFFNDTATTEIYTLSLHDALPIFDGARQRLGPLPFEECNVTAQREQVVRTDRQKRFPDRKSTRLNSSHSQISYAVFCLKKKKNAIATTKS